MEIDFSAGVKGNDVGEVKPEEKKALQASKSGAGEEISTALEVRVPETIDPFKSSVRRFEISLDEIVAAAESFKIRTSDDMKKSIDMISRLKGLWDDVEGARLDVVKKPKKFFSMIDSYCKGIKGRMESGIRAIKNQQTMFRQAELQKQREEEEKQRKEREALQKKLDDEAKEKGYDPVEVPEVVAPEPEKVVRSESGASLSFRTVWKYEITNPMLVCRALCSPDPKIIKSRIDGGLREGSDEARGLRIWSEEIPVTRK